METLSDPSRVKLSNTSPFINTYCYSYENLKIGPIDNVLLHSIVKYIVAFIPVKYLNGISYFTFADSLKKAYFAK